MKGFPYAVLVIIDVVVNDIIPLLECVKSIMGTMFSKFLSKLYLWGYHRGGAILSVVDQKL